MFTTNAKSFTILLVGLMFALAQPRDKFTWTWTEGDVNPCLSQLIQGGVAPNRALFSLARIHYRDWLLPGMTQPKNETHPTIALYNETLYTANPYEVLCGEATWAYYARGSTKTIPDNAVPVGYADNTTLYACRSYIRGSQYDYAAIGSLEVYESQLACHVPRSLIDGYFDGHTQSYSMEILVSSNSSFVSNTRS